MATKSRSKSLHGRYAVPRQCFGAVVRSSKSSGSWWLRQSLYWPDRIAEELPDGNTREHFYLGRWQIDLLFFIFRWYGKKALFLLIKEGSHHAKLEGQDSLIRVTDSGNFYVVSPDKAQPEAGCKVLTNNLCNGWIPKKNFFVPRSWQDEKIIALFIYRAQNWPSLLFLSTNIIITINSIF